MLLHEGKDDSLELGLGVPRTWLSDGKTIDASGAPTYFGATSLHITSHAASGSIQASVELERRVPISRLVLRLRHPDGKLLKSVSVDGKEWEQFDRQREWIIISKPTKSTYSVEARY